jgi:hypothetical protein
MTHLETIMQDKGLVERVMLEYLIEMKCPENFYLKEDRKKCKDRTFTCRECWEKALKEE